jgi:hypothetical protein
MTLIDVFHYKYIYINLNCNEKYYTADCVVQILYNVASQQFILFTYINPFTPKVDHSSCTVHVHKTSHLK